MRNALKNEPLSAAEHLKLEEILKNEPLIATEHLKMAKVMKNEPLSATDHLKVVTFVLLLIPSIFPFLLGIIPMLIFAFGYFMMKKNSDFSNVEASVKAARIYYKIVIFLLLLVAVFGLFSFLNNGGSFSRNPFANDELKMAFASSIIAAVAFVYWMIQLKKFNEEGTENRDAKAHGFLGKNPGI